MMVVASGKDLGLQGSSLHTQVPYSMENYDDKKDDTWEPLANVHPTVIKEFEVENDMYDYSWSFRFPVCDLPYKSERGVKLHKVKTRD